MSKVSNDVLGVLSRCEVKEETLYLPKERLDRKLYEAVNKCLEALGGKWNRRVGGHVFPKDPSQLLDGVMLTGEYTDWKNAFQFFPTPPEIAKELVAMASLQDGMRVLEPSAGTGVIVDAIKSTGLKLQIDVCELDSKHAPGLKEKARMVGEDFLKFGSGPVYDAVIANPPFTRQQDVDHVLHMVECCKPGGVVVSIMSAGVLFRSNAKMVQFRAKLGGRISITELPENSFKSSGTSVSAVIAFIKV